MKHYLAILFIVVTLLSSDIMAYSDNLLVSSIQADYILVEKSARRLTLFTRGRELRKYKIALGREPVGPKIKRGDNKTPEGIYFIDARNPESQYHLSLHISYPDKYDLINAEVLGVHPGGSIMIHGAGEKHAWQGKFHTAFDWTEGCIAVMNEEIEEIWQLVPDGTMIKIIP